MNAASAAINRTSARRSISWKITLILIPLVTLGLLLWLRQIEVNALRQRGISSYGAVPHFQLINQEGQPFDSARLTGKIWIADFIYTTCPGPCPMISTRMSELQEPLEKTDVHLVSFSVDPEKDKPKVLRGYAEKYLRYRVRCERPAWKATSASASLGRIGRRCTVPPSATTTSAAQCGGAGTSSSASSSVHSTRMVLVDRHGEIRGYYQATAADAVTKLLADTSHLLREQPK